jgi:23S rRNA pseudouridine1911/1915/1917 synthase
MANLKIIFEDTFLLVLEKEAGLVVNRSYSVKEKTLQDELSDYFGLQKKDLGMGGRAGIVHRLDKETSGLLVVAKTQKAYDFLTRQFAQRLVDKSYLALVHGKVEENTFSVVLPLGRHPQRRIKFATLFAARRAETQFWVLKRLRFKAEEFQKILAKVKKERKKYYQNNAVYYTLLEAKPKTGRTHQIRVHLKSQNHPLVSDPLYAGRFYKFDLSFCPRLFLHARGLRFSHPKLGKLMQFESPLPKELKEALFHLEES